ncbi:uncharacterized protein LOC118410394 isoform X2 [Branchiostoma floridae]|uniref:Uncharacterized protein LOC118410394 isoform X2 n=1 Tax=Branchiostoma floridae TaxID=7739 RepID=A0A9J7KQ38_BRAFL|nr:uncharacterized protein LOC118410394 isoform X2 [Branchiostoma floridae]
MDTLEMAMVFMETTNVTCQEILYMNPRAGKYIRCSYSEEDLPYISLTTAISGNNFYIGTEEPKGTDHLAVLEYSHAGNVWQRANMSTFQKPDMSRKSEIDEFLLEVDEILYYVFVERENISTSVWIRKYNRHTDQWQECSQLKIRMPNYLRNHSYHTVVSCGPHIYFLMKPQMHRYDPSQDRWCKLTPPKLEFCTTVAMGTEIFCTDREFSKTMVYDTKSDRWQTTNNLVYVYDKFTDTWRDLEATMPSGEYLTPDSSLPVACMYLPCLTAKGTDLSTACL